jgi:tetratricopeptide (TPR) repeat protein
MREAQPPAAPAPRAPAPPPPAARAARQAAAEAAAAEDSAQIMVTGSRVARDGYEARAPSPAPVDAAPLDGEWNACTLYDPRRNPTRCRSSAQVSEGLALAWQGDLDRAIRAFDRAIAAEPDLALAYLNRGLAYRQQGDLARALADLNRAVARDRTGARGYYHRSLLYRARGDEVRAEADAERAVAIDPDYAAAPP